MKRGKSPLPRDADEEISALIETLHRTGQRLEELTAGEVDTVADREGRTFMLRHTQEQLRHSEAAKQAAILNALPAHIALLDTQGRIVSVNEAWRRFGSADVLQGPGYGIGVDYLEICDSARGDDASEVHQVAEGIRSVLAGTVKSFSIEYACHSPTQQRWFLLTVSPLADDHPQGAVVMHLNITERKRAEEARQHRAAELAESQRIARIGSWEWTIATGVVAWSDGLNHVLGRDHGSPSPTFETLPQFYTPESWQRLGVVIARAIETGASYDLELEMIRPDGATCWTTTRGEAIRGADGIVVKLRGTVLDITERKRAEEEIRGLAKFPAENPYPVLRIGRDGTILYANQSSAPILTTWGREVGQNVPDDWQKWIAETFESGIVKEVEIECDRRIFSCHLAPILAEEYVNIYGRDITVRKQAEQELRESRQRLDGILTSAMDAIVTVDEEKCIVLANPAAERMFGYTAAELQGRPLDLLMPEHFRVAHSAHIAAFGKTGVTNRSAGALRTLSGLRKSGAEFPIEASISKDDSTGRQFFTAILRDITGRKQAEARIVHLNRVYAMLSGINTLIVRVRDRDELFREACRIAADAGGFRMTMIGMVERSTMTIVPVASAGKDEALLTSIKGILSSSESAPTTMTARAIREKKAVVSNDSQSDPQVLFGKKYAEAGVRSMAILPLIVADEAVGAFALYASEREFFQEEEMKLLTELADDISFAMDHIEKEKKLNYLAYYDELTGLANRSLFLERVAQYMRSAVSSGHKLAVFLIDLERFKNINDSLGRPAGDALLKQVAEWLKRDAGDANLVARLGADHFATVLPQVKQGGDGAQLLEESIKAFMDHPFRLNDAVFRVAVKVGVALFPDDGDNADTLFRNAEAALKKAKASGERYLFYTQKMTEAVAGKLSLENRLRQALDQREFVLHYQPKVNLASGKVTSAEALIRWNDPRTGLVSPGRFIPILEETGMIYDVGRWALRQAIKDYLRWHAAGLAAVRIAVNVSPLQLHHRGFVDEVRQAIGIDAEAAAGLELEITESLIMEDVKHSIANLQAIRALGVSIAIDDFGTGFSSLSYLAKLPVDTLKIDRSFVIDMTAGPEGLALVSTIINLAHSLKLKVVAEGVETEEQSSLLRLLDCDEMQGFLFCKPVPIEIFEAKYLAPASGT